MKKMLVACIALLSGVAIAAPLAWSADSQDQPRPAQAAPAEHGSAGQGTMGQGTMGQGTMGQGMMGHGMMGQGMMGQGMMGQGMMGQGMMGRMGGEQMGIMGHHGRMHLNPAQRCEERLARRAGMIAYTVTKLNLTAQQRPLWDKLNAVVQSGTEKEQQLCSALQPKQQNQEATILDRVERRERFLNARLQTLQQARPALEQFYQALSPEQKAIINHPFRRG